MNTVDPNLQAVFDAGLFSIFWKEDRHDALNSLVDAHEMGRLSFVDEDIHQWTERVADESSWRLVGVSDANGAASRVWSLASNKVRVLVSRDLDEVTTLVMT